MKYIKRILIILFLVIMISGCKVDYELKINKDLSVNERVKASENTNRMKSRTNLDVNQSVKYLYKIYKLDGMKDDSYSINSSSTMTSVTVHNSYDSIEDYSEKFLSELFECNSNYENKNDIKIEFDQLDLINSKASNRYIYDEISVTIDVPFEVIDNNADSIKGNRYTWIITRDAKEKKNIVLEFNGEKEKNTVSFSFGKRTVSLKYQFLILGLLVLGIGIVILVVYINNKKNNKM